ncbi:MAG: hypothetical protein A2745_02575 [Candidatus Harrisonbacteria bacterium RIFCSPHIGHO2_01_FULL_44_13]|nr:MAG: hypothetical protein A2745_02575 [Candidatus Harrisonbacteria bacterium RIFCSPHIGHO2_01_FULL_44_13]HLC39826.1 hypothetical protein [archaeon]
MEKPEILKKFLDNGLQLDFESLDFFSHKPNQINTFLQKVPSVGKPTTVTINFINEILQQPESDVEILKVPEKSRATIDIDEFAALVNTRYIFLKKLLAGRVDLVNLISINKITPKVKKFSVIIIVKEKMDGENSIVGEDETGEHTFFFKKKADFEQVFLDDVIGIVCESDERIKIEKMFWPDLPLRREVTRTEEDLELTVSNYPLARAADGKEIAITTEGHKAKINADVFDMPVMVKVKQSAVVLISNSKYLKKYQQREKNEEELIASLLKRRNLSPVIEADHAAFSNDPFLIDMVPDIFIIFDVQGSGSFNYKGTTVLMMPEREKEKTSWRINLKTRETKRIEN